MSNGRRKTSSEKEKDRDDEKDDPKRRRSRSPDPKEKKKKKVSRSRKRSSEKRPDRTKLEVECGPTPVDTRTPFARQEVKQLREKTRKAHKTTQDPSASQSKKRRASEEIGTEGAKTALRIRKKKDIPDKEITELRGPGVPDAYHEKSKTILEAKGGKSQLGSRKTSRGKRAKQCSPAYAQDIAEKLEQSEYKGHDPTVGCDKHKDKPDGTCKNCQRAERAKRRATGKSMTKALATGEAKKDIVRTDYDEQGIKDPEVTEVTVN